MLSPDFLPGSPFAVPVVPYFPSSSDAESAPDPWSTAASSSPLAPGPARRRRPAAPWSSVLAERDRPGPNGESRLHATSSSARDDARHAERLRPLCGRFPRPPWRAITVSGIAPYSAMAHNTDVSESRAENRLATSCRLSNSAMMVEEARPSPTQARPWTSPRPDRRAARARSPCACSPRCASRAAPLGARAPSTTAAPRAAELAASRRPRRRRAGEGPARPRRRRRPPRRRRPRRRARRPTRSDESSTTARRARASRSSGGAAAATPSPTPSPTSPTPVPTCLTLERVETNEAEQRTKNSMKSHQRRLQVAPSPGATDCAFGDSHRRRARAPFGPRTEPRPHRKNTPAPSVRAAGVPVRVRGAPGYEGG